MCTIKGVWMLIPKVKGVETFEKYTLENFLRTGSNTKSTEIQT